MVEGLHLAEVVGEILAHLVDVGQELWHLSLQVIGVDPPEFLAGSLDPFPVDVGRAEPVAERSAFLARGQEVGEVLFDLIVEHLLGPFDRLASRNHPGDVLRETIESRAGLLIGEFAGTIGGVARCPGRPDLVGFADVVAVRVQQERVARDALVPHGPLQDRTLPGAPEVLPGEHRAAAWRAGWGGDVGILKEHALARHAVEVGGRDDVVAGAGTVGLRVGTGETPPVVSEGEQDVGARPVVVGNDRGKGEADRADAGGKEFHDCPNLAVSPGAAKSRLRLESVALRSASP